MGKLWYVSYISKSFQKLLNLYQMLWRFSKICELWSTSIFIYSLFEGRIHMKWSSVPITTSKSFLAQHPKNILSSERPGNKSYSFEFDHFIFLLSPLLGIWLDARSCKQGEDCLTGSLCYQVDMHKGFFSGSTNMRVTHLTCEVGMTPRGDI